MHALLSFVEVVQVCTSRRFFLFICARQISASASRYESRKCCTDVTSLWS